MDYTRESPIAPSLGSASVQRRKLLTGAAGLAAVAAAGGMPGPAAAQGRGRTLVIASSATPQSMDVENALSIGSRNVMAGFYDNLTRYPLMNDPRQPAYQRENFGVAPEGQLAQRWEWSADNRRITFHLREGVRSGWGNPLTAEDVKYTFDRKFALRGRDGFMTRALGMSDPDQVRVEGPLAVSFSIERPNAMTCSGRSPAAFITASPSPSIAASCACPVDSPYPRYSTKMEFSPSAESSFDSQGM